MPYCVDLPADPAIRRILVMKWSAMGDVIIATALFEDIARAFPGREIHLNTLPPWKHLFQDDPRFQQVFSFDLRGREHSYREMWRWLRHVRRMQYDLVIDLQTTDRSRLLLGLLGLSGQRIPYRLGNHPILPYNIAPPRLKQSTHAIDRMRAALRAGGIVARTPRPVLHIPDRNRERAHKLQQTHDLRTGDYAVFFPGCQAAGHLKRWGASRYAALAQRLRDTEGLSKVVLIGAKDEMEECQQIERECGPWLVNLCGQTEILDIVPLCEPARLLVANDTGTAHVAAATDRPMVVICGPTDPHRVKPLGDNVVALQADLPCINCYQKDCAHHSCMPAITPDRVIATLRALQTFERDRREGSASTAVAGSGSVPG